MKPDVAKKPSSRSSKRDSNPDSRKIMTRSASRALIAEAATSGTCDINTPKTEPEIGDVTECHPAKFRPANRRKLVERPEKSNPQKVSKKAKLEHQAPVLVSQTDVDVNSDAKANVVSSRTESDEVADLKAKLLAAETQLAEKDAQMKQLNVAMEQAVQDAAAKSQRYDDLRDSLIKSFESHFNCPLCFEPLIVPTILPCEHTFCFSCITTWKATKLSSNQTPDCPICRARMPREAVKLNLLSAFIDEVVPKIYDPRVVSTRAAAVRERNMPSPPNRTVRVRFETGGEVVIRDSDEDEDVDVVFVAPVANPPVVIGQANNSA